MSTRPPELDDVGLETGVTQLPPLRPVGSVLIACVPLAVVVPLLGLLFTGATTQTLIIDPGDLVTYGLPVARIVHDLAAAVSIGLLVLAAFALPGQNRAPGVLSFAQFAAVRWASWSAGVWFLAGSVVIVLTAASVIGVPLADPIFRRQFLFFATGLELGQSLVVSTLCVLVVFVITYLTRSVSWTGAAAALSLLALLPLSLSGHAAGSDEHANAVNSLAIHLLGVTVWVGGLTALILLRKKVSGGLPVVAARYSALAGWSFVAVALSGVVNVSLRFTGIGDLVTTEYGLLVSAKILILVFLGIAGALHRRRVIPGLVREPTRRRGFVRLALAEVVLMAVAMGLSVALSRSAPPVPQTSIANVDPRSSLIGFTFPEPVSVSRMLTAFHPDWAWLAIAAVFTGLYLAGVIKLRRRGDRWSAARTVPWVAGCVVLAYATSGGPGVYGAVHFSTHMIQHMLLMMYVPPLLVLGAPVTLLLRLVPARRDHSRGIREWVLLLTHSRYAQLVTHPIVAAVVFAGSLIAFYYTGWFRWSLETHQGHLLMTVHFLISGYLFFFVLIGIDPGPKRPPYPMRLIILLATMAFHAFFGLAIMSGTEVLALDWWHALDATDDTALLADQVTGGGIAWGTGELPVVLVALMVVRQWSRSEERAAKRYDRKADRDDDATLRAYNDRLARLHGSDTNSRDL